MAATLASGGDALSRSGEAPPAPASRTVETSTTRRIVSGPGIRIARCMQVGPEGAITRRRREVHACLRCKSGKLPQMDAALTRFYPQSISGFRSAPGLRRYRARRLLGTSRKSRLLSVWSALPLQNRRQREPPAEVFRASYVSSPAAQRLVQLGQQHALEIFRIDRADELIGDAAVAADHERLRHAVDAPFDRGAAVRVDARRRAPAASSSSAPAARSGRTECGWDRPSRAGSGTAPRAPEKKSAATAAPGGCGGARRFLAAFAS